MTAPRKAALTDIPDTPLSRAAAQIAKQLNTKIRGATASELNTLDAIAKEGNWEIGGRVVHLTNLDKLLFPEDRFTKRDLIRYYVQVAPVRVPGSVSVTVTVPMVCPVPADSAWSPTTDTLPDRLGGNTFSTLCADLGHCTVFGVGFGQPAGHLRALFGHRHSPPVVGAA